MGLTQTLPNTRHPLAKVKNRIGLVSIESKEGIFPVLDQNEEAFEVIRMADNQFIYTEWLNRNRCGCLIT